MAEISVPHSCSVIWLTFRVETPFTYISAIASFRHPTRVATVLFLKPLA